MASSIERCGRRTIRCGPGTLLFTLPGEEHSDEFESQEAVLLGIELDDMQDTDRKLSDARKDMAGPSTRIARQLARELAQQCPISNLVVESLAAELVSNCSQGTGRKGTPAWLGTAVEIADDLYAGRLSLDPVAAGVHPIHLARQFRSRIGCTYGEYLRRIPRARSSSSVSARRLSPRSRPRRGFRTRATSRDS